MSQCVCVCLCVSVCVCVWVCVCIAALAHVGVSCIALTTPYTLNPPQADVCFFPGCYKRACWFPPPPSTAHAPPNRHTSPPSVPLVRHGTSRPAAAPHVRVGAGDEEAPPASEAGSERVDLRHVGAEAQGIACKAVAGSMLQSMVEKACRRHKGAGYLYVYPGQRGGRTRSGSCARCLRPKPYRLCLNPKPKPERSGSCARERERCRRPRVSASHARSLT